VLAHSLAEGRVVMSYAFTFDAAAKTESPCVLHSVAAVVVEGGSGSPADRLFHPSGVVCSLPALNQSAGASGYINASPDRDGLLRRIPLLVEYKGQIYPSLALATTLKATGEGGLVLTALAGDRARLGTDKRSVTLDERGTFLVRFRGKRGTYRHIPASDILRGRTTPGMLEGRIVFVGATALGVQDVVPTAFDTKMWGIEVHASAADALLQGDFVFSPASWRAYELVATLVLGLAATSIVALAGYLYGGLLATCLLAVLWWVTFVAVDSRHVFFSPVFPTAAVVTVLMGATVAKVRHEYRRANEERARRELAHRFTVQSLTSLMETRDGPTGRHARRTQAYARLIATRLARHPRFRDYLTPERVDLLSRLAPLHDIGKVAVRDVVLLKAGPLTAEERRDIQQHPRYGYEAIANAERLAGGGAGGDETLMQMAKDIVYTHHERWDGAGYPRGLRGEDIPIAGRIVALVDVYDALTNSRTYRLSVPHEQAIAAMKAGRGTHFDPDVVDAFLAVEHEFGALATELRGEGPEDRPGPRTEDQGPGTISP
jgi:adenylate cyclase